MGNDVCVSLRGNLDAHTTKLWVGISKTLYLSSYNLHLETTLEYYNAILTKMPKCIEGYPSSLYTFACNLETLGLSCNIPFCFTSSENLLDYQRKKIEQVFNSQIYDIYGLTEGSIKLVENFNHKGYFETPGYSINEFSEDCILTTGLVDDGFPMIRYKVNDIVELNKEKIVGINGRSNSYIYGKDGTAYSAGLTSIVRSFSNIDNAQLIQCKQGQLLVNVVSKEILSESFKRNVLQIIDQKIGLNNIDVVICQISADELIYSKGRKFNFIVQKSF